jgi:hypothetical protein
MTTVPLIRFQGVSVAFLTDRLGLVSLYQAPRQERPTKEKHKTRAGKSSVDKVGCLEL